MLKKTWVASIAFATLSLSTVALADDNYNCPEGNCNYNSNDYYGPAPLPIATPAPLSPWYGAGFIIGIQGGYANTHWSNLNLTDPFDPADSISIKDTGAAARLYLGYDFNRFIGIELGGTMMPKATISSTGLIPVANQKNPSISNTAFDLLPVITVPVVGGLNLHAKAGLGYFKSSLSKITFTDPDTMETSTFSQSSSHVGPAFGAGVGYEFVPNFAIALDWMRYSGNGKIQNIGGTGTSTKNGYQPSPDLVLIGLQYKFPVRIS